jgi:hypothetical protein
MNRCLAIVLALLFASLTVSSACAAAPAEWIGFTLDAEHGDQGKIEASFSDRGHQNSRNQWSGGFMPSELIGLDISGFRGSGTRPLRFALVREAGRLDCAGNGGGSRAAGACSFTPDAGFMQFLASRGIGRPGREQAFGLMALHVRRELIDGIASARYPVPTVDQLMALTAVGVTGDYVAEMSRAGYRPQSIDGLVEFKALGITPGWISGFARIGYANIPAHQLVELRALGITPEFVRSAAAGRSSMPPVKELVEMKIFGRKQ